MDLWYITIYNWSPWKNLWNEFYIILFLCIHIFSKILIRIIQWAFLITTFLEDQLLLNFHINALYIYILHIVSKNSNNQHSIYLGVDQFVNTDTDIYILHIYKLRLFWLFVLMDCCFIDVYTTSPFISIQHCKHIWIYSTSLSFLHYCHKKTVKAGRWKTGFLYFHGCLDSRAGK